MRFRCALPLVCVAGVLGCGDGIGRPIVERRQEAPGPSAGSGGGGGRVEEGGRNGGPKGGGRDGAGGRSLGGFAPDAGRGSFAGAAGGGADVPPGDYCASVTDWSPEAAESEDEIFRLLNFTREAGISCTESSTLGSVPPVVMKPELRCAARLHARDMSERGILDHVGSDGLDPEGRMQRAGYTGFGTSGESIVRGPSFDGSDPYPPFQALLATGGVDCENLMNSAFDSVGVGRFEDYWTLDFAGP